MRANTLGMLAFLLVVTPLLPAGMNANAGEGSTRLSAIGLRETVRKYRQAHEKEILQEFVTLLSLPNVARDSVNIRRNAEHIQQLLSKRGVAAELLHVPGSPPIVFGELRHPGAQKTVILYAHYDGQPVNPDAWASPPWQPVLRKGRLEDGAEAVDLAAYSRPFPGEWRLYARSAGDDKAPVIGILAALDALAAANISPGVHLKFFFEGEEEAGSRHLRTALEKYRSRLQADLWLLCDGPVHQTRRKQLAFGARGIIGFDITTYGPLRPLHSGHYGNWAPNPIMQLVHVLAGMRDETGRILIENYYDDVRPITASERHAIDEMPSLEAQLKQELALGRTEGEGKRLEELIMQPALNVKGIASGQVGRQARNAIQTQATASVGLRLVPDQQPEIARRRVEAHLRRLGFHIVYRDPDPALRRKHAKLVKLRWGHGYPPSRTSLDHPASLALEAAIENTLGEQLIKLPTMGGSVPMYLFTEMLNTPAIILPIANHDNNQHAENENLRLQNLWDGIEMYAAVFAKLGEAWRSEK